MDGGLWHCIIDSVEKTLESPLDCKEIEPVHSEGDQPWDFFGRNDAKAETPVLWPPHAKSWLIGKNSDAGRDWGQKKKGTTEDEMAGWHHWLDGHESEWTPGVVDGQGGLACCSSSGRKESDMTEQLNWTELNTIKTGIGFKRILYVVINFVITTLSIMLTNAIRMNCISFVVLFALNFVYLVGFLKLPEGYKYKGVITLFRFLHNLRKKTQECVRILFHLITKVQYSLSVVYDSLRPHRLQNARLPGPSPTPRAYSNSCPLSRWCYPIISSSVIPFSWLQSFPASGSFPMS